MDQADLYRRVLNQASKDAVPALPLTDAYGDIQAGDDGALLSAPYAGDHGYHGASLSGPTREGKASGDPNQRAGLAGTKASQSGGYRPAPRPASAPPRAPTPEELMKQAEAMLKANQEQYAAQLERGPSVDTGERSMPAWLEEYRPDPRLQGSR